MEVHFSAELEARIAAAAAARQGKDAAQVVEETVARAFDDHERFLAAVDLGIEQDDRGELVEHKEVVERVERIFRP